MGVGSAGIAVIARGGLMTARGFVIPPAMFAEFLKKDKVAKALAMFRSVDVDEKESRKSLGAAFLDERIQWGDEMDMVVAFRELDGTVALTSTTRLGTDSGEVYADNEIAFLEMVKDCWLKWLVSGWKEADENILPALMVRQVPDAEVSIELRKKENGIHARAVFGLPAGLADTTVSPDIYDFDPVGELERMEQRKQEWQYVLGKHGVVRTAVASDFQDEEKASGEMLDSLADIMSVMHKASKMDRCQVCFVNDKPVVYSASLIPESQSVDITIPHREDSLTLMSAKTVQATGRTGPVVAAKIMLNIIDGMELDAAQTGMDGLFITSHFIETNKDWPEKAGELVKDANRRFGSSRLVMALDSIDDVNIEDFSNRIQPLKETGANISLVLPASRNVEELRDVAGDLKRALRRQGIECWLTVRFPSNLFFLDELAENADVLALDLETFSRLMTGNDEGGWLNYSLPALRKAYTEIIDGAFEKETPLAIIRPNLIGTPGLLEFLIKEGVEILCTDVDDLGAVRHIVASIEKRMLLEMGVDDS